MKALKYEQHEAKIKLLFEVKGKYVQKHWQFQGSQTGSKVSMRCRCVAVFFINKQHTLWRKGRIPNKILPHSSLPLCEKTESGNSSHVSKSYRGISLRSWPFSSIPPHISESFSFVSPGNRSAFFKLSSKEGKKKKRRGGGKSPLHVLLCPLITCLSLKQMADHLPVYISAPWFERVAPKNLHLLNPKSQN